MSGYSTDVQAGLALSANWGHPEMLQVQDSGWDFTSQACGSFMKGVPFMRYQPVPCVNYSWADG